MTMDQAAVFLASSILVGITAIIVTIIVVIINNLLHRYWKPFNLYKLIDSPRFAEPHELEKMDKDKK